MERDLATAQAKVSAFEGAYAATSRVLKPEELWLVMLVMKNGAKRGIIVIRGVPTDAVWIGNIPISFEKEFYDLFNSAVANRLMVPDPPGRRNYKVPDDVAAGVVGALGRGQRPKEPTEPLLRAQTGTPVYNLPMPLS